jgi:hypothetical protein
VKSGLDQHPLLLRGLATYRNRPAKAAARDLRKQSRIIGIGLVVLQFHHRVGLARINHIHRQAIAPQTPRQPARLGPRLQNNPTRTKAMRPQSLKQRTRIAQRLALKQNLTRVIPNAKTRRFLRYVKSDILNHGHSPCYANWGGAFRPRILGLGE